MNSFGARAQLHLGTHRYRIFRLQSLERQGFAVDRLPYSLKILLEGLLRHEDGVVVRPEDIEGLARRKPGEPPREIAFIPARVLLQDFTGVPALVDLAGVRHAIHRLGKDAKGVNPQLPVELVIDHSVQIDAFGAPEALQVNVERDYERNRERYAFLRWGQKALRNFKVVPPHTGIVHQVNLEHLARVVFSTDELNGGEDADMPLAYPDTVVGTDSHTPMVNGLGVLGWGVGGIEAEAAMLGQPISIVIPQVIGFRVHGELREGATATDLVLTVTQMLRRKGVVGSIVEFFGPGVASLSLEDRATIGNMSPEYGATATLFPIDEETLRYLHFTGRSPSRVRLVEAYAKEQGLFHAPGAPEAEYDDTLELDLATVEPSMAGPRRPQDRLALGEVGASFRDSLPSMLPAEGSQALRTSRLPQVDEAVDLSHRSEREDFKLDHGSVVIAAITSCTNTSNPEVMIAAGLLARKARALGLSSQPWVKTSLAPGSRVVTDYLAGAGLTADLEALGFHLVGYGCTTCIGNSGPLPGKVSEQIARHNLVVCAVLSGNRNFEGRIHPEVRANYLASPPLVVAYALTGRIDISLRDDPIGVDAKGREVFLRDIWPSRREIRETIESCLRASMFQEAYEQVYEGDSHWRALPVPEEDLYRWDERSTYVRLPPYLENIDPKRPALGDLREARCIALLGDSVTTDHISPAGAIAADSPAGEYLASLGVPRGEFNSYGSRRGNHEVMMRGTFANPRLKNALAPGREGGWTTHWPSREVVSIYEAAMRYQREGTPTVVIAGKEYGTGSSRDWAGKGPALLGIRATLAESYERIHRSNLVGMGVLPLQFVPGESAGSLGLTGKETFDIRGLDSLLAMSADGHTSPRVQVMAKNEGGEVKSFDAIVRIDTPRELEYFRHGGILPAVVRQLSGRAPEPTGATVPDHPLPSGPSSAPGVGCDQGSWESFPASDPPAH